MKKSNKGNSDIKSIRERIQDSLSAEPSIADQLIIASRLKPLSDDEIAAFGDARKKKHGVEVYPYVSFDSVGEGRKRKTVVYVGIKGNF